MNITAILNLIDFTPEEDRAMLYSTSLVLTLMCAYRGACQTKRLCMCLAQKYVDYKESSVTSQPLPFLVTDVEKQAEPSRSD